MARRFTATFYSNCAICEDLIEPDDEAAYLKDVEGAVCEDCVDREAELTVEPW